MKIFYCIRNNASANIYVKKFVEALNPKHEVKIASWYDSSYCFDNVDILYDSIIRDTIIHKTKHSLVREYGTSKIPPCHEAQGIEYLNFVKRYSPDLIISDYDYFGHVLASIIKCPVWYCSSIHLFDGVKKPTVDTSYFFNLRDVNDHFVNDWPKHRTLIYSPYREACATAFENEGYEWVKPYHTIVRNRKNNCDVLAFISDKKRVKSLIPLVSNLTMKVVLFHPFENGYFSELENYNLFNVEQYKRCLASCGKVFTDGDVNAISDAVYNKKNMVISPSLKDYSGMTHASCFSDLGISEDVGQVEFMKSWGLFELETALNKRAEKVEFFNSNKQFLHEIVESYANERGI